MSGNITFTIIKPFAVSDGHIGPILNKIHTAGFKISAMRMLWLTQGEAERFYEVHKERPFYSDLVEFMTSGPIVVAVLKKENAVADYRKLIGATDPEKAEEGTIRKEFARSLRENAVHGSDSDENAAFEGSFFFSGLQRF
ncbi:MAG: nucleoside-diphosphate kinase [Bacteroidetes bacterium]|nr:MAG: nucleoside-diphosphate kinase [Bacteroidota bacterium]RLD69561.1 MAG: nucleoside-diphosphate kinase [Bacteroidota bacterium]RLD93105.1 MAG: nucleoside-diphosphate kinase [Bacteroidota bacterium]